MGKMQLINNEVTISCGVPDVICEYEVAVLKKNQIYGLLPVNFEYIDDMIESHYNIEGCTSLEAYYKNKCIGREDFNLLMRNLKNMMGQIDDYLLSEDGIVLSADYIFYNSSEHRFYFCYQLGVRLGLELEFQALMDWIVKKVDYADKELVVAVYGIQSGEQRALDQFWSEQTDIKEEKEDSEELADMGVEIFYDNQLSHSDVVREEDVNKRKKSALLTKVMKWFTLDE